MSKVPPEAVARPATSRRCQRGRARASRLGGGCGLEEALRTLGTDAGQASTRRAWPGKVRERRNAIERACLLSESDRIEASRLRDDTGRDDADPAAQQRPSTESPMPRLEAFLRLQERALIRRKSLWDCMKRLAVG